MTQSSSVAMVITTDRMVSRSAVAIFVARLGLSPTTENRMWFRTIAHIVARKWSATESRRVLRRRVSLDANSETVSLILFFGELPPIYFSHALSVPHADGPNLGRGRANRVALIVHSLVPESMQTE